MVNGITKVVCPLGGIALSKFNYGNTRLCDICSNLTINTSERGHSPRSDVLLLSLNILFTFCRAISLLTLNN